MKKAGDIVKDLLNGITDNAKYLGIFREWDKIIGPDIAAHAKIRDIDQNLILVDIDHPGWLQKLQLKERKIIQIIQKKYPSLDIKGLKLYLKTIDIPK